MDYCFKPTAIRDLKRLPKTTQERILGKFEFYLKSENPLRFAEALKDRSLGDFRFRIGDYRMIFDVDFKRNIAIILTVGHRKDIYR